ncbi:MAG: 4-(cytidine 5'-diphospho)-2-C-methyl-D-erythritol kinase [Pseudomonadota bacterium]
MTGLWFSPAKINIMLHVVGKRADGYHNLQTIFQFLDFGDWMRFEPNSDGILKRDYEYGFDEHTDINLRAAQLLRDYVGVKSLGVTISLDKYLPMGGGLGGGSSNAATTLIALNDLWSLNLPDTILMELGLKLGADVPIFIYGKSAWAEGVGEQLFDIELPTPWYLVLYPKVGVSTAQVFSNNRLTPTPEMKKIRALRRSDLLASGGNDLQPVVRRLVPEVDALLGWMEGRGEARMSGSGGSAFMPCDSEQEAMALLQDSPDQFDGFVAQGLNTIDRCAKL